GLRVVDVAPARPPVRSRAPARARTGGGEPGRGGGLPSDWAQRVELRGRRGGDHRVDADGASLRGRALARAGGRAGRPARPRRRAGAVTAWRQPRMRSYRPWSWAASMNHFTTSGLERGGISQEVDRMNPEWRAAVSTHRTTSALISSRVAVSNLVASTLPMATARPRATFMKRASWSTGRAGSAC